MSLHGESLVMMHSKARTLCCSWRCDSTGHLPDHGDERPTGYDSAVRPLPPEPDAHQSHLRCPPQQQQQQLLHHQSRPRERSVRAQTIFASPTDPPHEEGPAAKDAMKDPKIHSFVNNNVHREMAVDVPDSFVAVTKTAPRYPPPRRKPPRAPPDTSSLKKNGLYHFTAEPATPNHVRSVSSQDGCPDATPERRTPPTPRISELMGKAGEPPQEEEKLIELNQLHRIRKYQVGGSSLLLLTFPFECDHHQVVIGGMELFLLGKYVYPNIVSSPDNIS
ncbi:MAGUK p55 subfamily member 5 [Caerostris extrusa]|uniref:MAGUK p55 subfamily member 5 n=1 Tax=Caerostris extrusa TaxID=172846 RepID=A0AAV4QA26_CAEEX|nr:MAGUK p55 subfamily member 5 [Caerostris extrusa]